MARAAAEAVGVVLEVPATTLSGRQCLLKRSFDIVAAGTGLILFGWAIVLLSWLAARSTGGSGLFRQERIGRHGRPFEIRKLRTMRPGPDGMTELAGRPESTVTTANDPRITRLGAFLRRAKLDELPQLVNVLRGEMSLVGPRPDVAEYLPKGAQGRLVLSVRPGVTGPATLVFRNEEEVLARQPDPEHYTRTVLVPAKARINEHYVRTWRLRHDIRYLLLTVTGGSLTETQALGWARPRASAQRNE
jgi:lipopolysaccharide/colanic/teichoic acid biosynthesis glycosyltransferase